MGAGHRHDEPRVTWRADADVRTIGTSARMAESYSLKSKTVNLMLFLAGDGVKNGRNSNGISDFGFRE